jgi:LAO/AO transport system kinase
VARRREWTRESLAEGVRDGDRRALARAISLVENGDPLAYELVRDLYPHTGGSYAIGVTGPPGVGKSTLISELVRHVRARELTVGVISVDPSSPFSHGALLGDRIRLADHFLDPGVYIRSMGTRGHLGGLAEATLQAKLVLDASGKDLLFLETVGAGQSEVAVIGVADSVLLVLMPGSGDSVQALKAGIMEIPDVLVVTKADLGQVATRTRRDLSSALRSLGSAATPVLAVSSLSPPSGVQELIEILDDRRAGLDIAKRRLRARRASALSEFVCEHGERGLRALGGRSAAVRLLAEQEPGLEVPTLIAALERGLA